MSKHQELTETVKRRYRSLVVAYGRLQADNMSKFGHEMPNIAAADALGYSIEYLEAALKYVTENPEPAYSGLEKANATESIGVCDSHLDTGEKLRRNLDRIIEGASDPRVTFRALQGFSLLSTAVSKLLLTRTVMLKSFTDADRDELSRVLEDDMAGSTRTEKLEHQDYSHLIPFHGDVDASGVKGFDTVPVKERHPA